MDEQRENKGRRVNIFRPRFPPWFPVLELEAGLILSFPYGRRESHPDEKRTGPAERACDKVRNAPRTI